MLDDLESGFGRLAPYKKPGSVVIYAPREFAARWLLTRLPDLLESCPSCCPWIDSSERPIDFGEMEVSLAILYAEVPPVGVEAVKLLSDRIAPVLSPALSGKRASATSTIARPPRLNSEHFVRWEDWYAAANVDARDDCKEVDFSDRDLALTAAEDGFGVALASLPMAAIALAANKLVAPFELALTPPRAWYAVTTPRELADPTTLAVWRWLNENKAKDATS